jgi:hypothetical protein
MDFKKYCMSCKETTHNNAGIIEETGVYCGYGSRYDGMNTCGHYLFFTNDKIPNNLKIGDSMCDNCIHVGLETNMIYIDSPSKNFECQSYTRTSTKDICQHYKLDETKYKPVINRWTRKTVTIGYDLV